MIGQFYRVIPNGSGLIPHISRIASIALCVWRASHSTSMPRFTLLYKYVSVVICSFVFDEEVIARTEGSTLIVEIMVQDAPGAIGFFENKTVCSLL